MRKIKDAPQFIHERGLSQNQTAMALSLSRSTVQDYLARAQASGLPIEALRALDPENLEATLFPTPSLLSPKRPEPDLARLERELHLPGVVVGGIPAGISRRPGIHAVL